MSVITKKYLNQKYDELYDKAEKLFKEKDPCRIAICPTKVYCAGYASGNVALCCRAFADVPRCKHWSEKKGCLVKSLRCKLWLCTENTSYPGVEYPYMTWVIKHDEKIEVTETVLMNKSHSEIIAEMKAHYFDELFREGKGKVINHAYEIFKTKRAKKENMDPEFKINLGVIVKSRISGFKGIVVSRAQHINGCNRYFVEPRMKKKDIQMPEGYWIDEMKLEVLVNKEMIKGENTVPPEGFSSQIK